MNDIGAVEIAAGLAGTMTIGTVVFYLLQIIKGLFPSLGGRGAELCVLLVSLAATALAVVSTQPNWLTSEPWVALCVGTLATTMLARGLYHQLFRPGKGGE